MIAIGYLGAADALPPPLRKHELGPRTRRPLEELVFEGAWGQSSSILTEHGDQTA
jgi:hypothetical protein